MDPVSNHPSHIFLSGVSNASAVGSLIYALVASKPDLAHPVGIVSRFIRSSERLHWKTVKWILNYLKGTS